MLTIQRTTEDGEVFELRRAAERTDDHPARVSVLALAAPVRGAT
jgi:hypothetical protein